MLEALLTLGMLSCPADIIRESYQEFLATEDVQDYFEEGMSVYDEEVVTYHTAKQHAPALAKEEIACAIDVIAAEPLMHDPVSERRMKGVFLSGILSTFSEPLYIAHVPAEIWQFGAFLERGNVTIGLNQGAETFYKTTGSGYLIEQNAGKCAFWSAHLGRNKRINKQLEHGGYHGVDNVRNDGPAQDVCLFCD